MGTHIHHTGGPLHILFMGHWLLCALPGRCIYRVITGTVRQVAGGGRLELKSFFRSGASG